MSEPEDVLLDGAHHATLYVRRLWRRNRDGAEPEQIRLEDVRARLEFFVQAAFGPDLTLSTAQAPAHLSWFARWGRRIPKHLVERRTLASTDGERVRLPRSLPALSRDGGGLDRYRLLAAESAARAARGTCGTLPADLLQRDLYLLQESATVERSLWTDFPGLRAAIREARAVERGRRPDAEALNPCERAVEALLQDELRADLDSDGVIGAVEESLAWAEARAAEIGALGGPYRGLPAVEHWGTVEAPPPAPPDHHASGTADESVAPARTSRLDRRPKVRTAADDEDDEAAGIWMIQLDDPQETVEDPMGLNRPTDRDDEADADDLAESLAELPEARLVTAPGSPREVLASDDPPPTGAAVLTRNSATQGLVYPEWDYRTGSYHEHGAVVRIRTAPLGPSAWAEDVLKRRAALLHEVRRRFERLRPRRMRLGRQLDGPELDIGAYVASHADRQAGVPADDRLYEAVRPARRDVAIALLVDASGSTDSWVTEALRVVDVEKEALLVVCDALDALGDPYTIQAFSGEGPENVSLVTLKDFDERTGATVNRRIAGLEPDRYTRMGAAIRHATATLMTKPARHRLLLLLSDGKPNDVDRYEGRYGIEDSRQAVVEARLQGLHPFCVTVDRHAPAYMTRIFGSGGFAALHHPEHLPSVLVDVLRRLVRG